jgi:type II secretory pathway pseudopilin PulG
MTTQRSRTDERAATRRPASRRDAGFSFVEIVITIVLMGIVMIGVLAAVRGSIRASAVGREAAEVETVLVNAIDGVTRADRGDFPCDLSGPVEAAVERQGWPASSATVQHQYLDVAGNWISDPFGSGTACPNGVFQTGLVQKVTISITSPDRRVSRTLEVVKGDV